MKLLLPAALLLIAPGAFAASPSCPANTAQAVQAIFSEGEKINDEFKAAAAGDASSQSAKYQALLDRIQEFADEKLIPCAEAAARMLADKPDPKLADAFLALIVNQQNSADEEIPESLARFFSAQPEAFAAALGRVASADACVVVGSVSFGWDGLKRDSNPDDVKTKDDMIRKFNRRHGCDKPG